MNIQEIEKALASAREVGGLVGEFMVLQDVMVLLTLRGSSTGTEVDREYGLVFYNWYVTQLLRLNDELAARKLRLGPGYQFRAVEKDNGELVRLRISALLELIPEVIRVQVPAN